MDGLEDIRGRINEIDSKLAELFEQRMAECGLVAEIKRREALPVSDPAREAEVIRRNSALVKDDTIREYFVSFEQELIALSRKYQRRLLSGMRVAYNGVPGAFAGIAAARMFPGAELVPFSDFESAYGACASGDCDTAVLPFENSSAGEVAAVTDLMFSGPLYINKVEAIEAVQNLLGCDGASLDTVTQVVSHPQALSQCADYIRRHGFTSHEYPNTASAAKMVAETGDVGMAAIGSAECAEIYGLKVIEARINEASVNTTRFAAFSRAQSFSKTRDSHFILMFTVKNEAGSLAKTLNIIGAHGYNMSCLRSRPMKGLMWNYYFYVELDGNIDTREGRSMLTELGTLCDKLKVAGSF